jgi:hypothetical protein
MSIDEALQELAEYYHTATVTQRVVMRRIFVHYGREDLIQD